MQVRLTLGVVVITILSVGFAITTGGQQASEPSKTDKKQLEAEARHLVAEGQTLEQQGKLVDAKDKYVDADALLPTGEALAAIKRVNDEEKQKVESLLTAAHHLYDAGKASESVETLQQGLEMAHANPALHYDLALSYLKLGDRANAALLLNLAATAVPNPKERTELLELQSGVVMGTSAPVAGSDAHNSLAIFNENFLETDSDPGSTKPKGVSLCDQMKDLRNTSPANAAVAFNSAKCAEEDAQPGEAARALGDYTKLAPQALDRAQAEYFRQDLLSLSSLKGDAGQLVRRHYANAARYLDYGRYDRATAEYQAAAQVLPDYALTPWRLGLLYEACGSIPKAREEFSRFQQLTAEPIRKSEADSHLSSLDRRRAVYDANVNEGQDILSTLLLTSMGLDTEGAKHKTKLTYRQWRWASQRYKGATRATVNLPQPYVERELNRARQDLEGAGELFPLGAEANELLALVFLQGNNWPAAYRSYDAVASQGFPVSFYAQVYPARDSKVVRAAKVEIGTDTVRLVYLSTYDPKKQISVLPATPAGVDNLGNLVVSPTQPSDTQAEARTILLDDLRGVETDKNFVVLKLPSDQVYLAPLNMLSETPFEGGASRTFGNEYTRLFIRYLGYENAKLGKEGMTAGEKFLLGFEIARIGVGVGMMGVGIPAAYGSTVRMARLAHALQVYRTIHSVAQGVRIANVADAATRLADDLQMSAASLERALSEQESAIAGMEFKVIPTQQNPLKYREKF